MHPLQIRTFLSCAVIGGVIVYLAMTKNGMKFWKRRDNPPKQIKPDHECDEEPGAGPSHKEYDEEHGVGPSDQCRYVMSNQKIPLRFRFAQR